MTIAVENYYPELPIVRGEVHDYSVWPRELAGQIRAVDHAAVGICLDVGHAALAAGVFGFDYMGECAAAAPLVRHLHLHDNLMNTNLTGTPRPPSIPSTGWETCICRPVAGPFRSMTSSGWRILPRIPRAAWSSTPTCTP